MSRPAFYIINGITLYRLAATPFLLWLVFTGHTELFKYALMASFFTDAIDGFLARRFGITSVLGARLDSIGDDLTVAAAIVGMFVLFPDFFRERLPLVILLAVLYVVQMALAFIRYGKPTSFHTYVAKVSAVLQAIFLLWSFFFGPNAILFYTASILTALDLAEEIIMILLIPEYRSDVRGIYWINKKPPR